MLCYLDLGDITLGQDHDTPFGYGQQLCEMVSRSDKAVRSYGPDTMLTDGQTDRMIPIYPNFVCGGMNIQRAQV